MTPSVAISDCSAQAAACVSNADTIKPGVAAEGAGLCPLPVYKLADINRNQVAQNTLALALVSA